MGTWIEIRCENRSEPSAEGRGIKVGDRCYSHDNSGPMDMASDTRASVAETLRFLNEDARESGWKKTREGWICPFCVMALKSAN